VKPHITKQVQNGESEQVSWPSLGLNPRHLARIVEAMNSVANVQGGTAYGARIKEDGMAMGGKTGTSQVRRISMAERSEGVIGNDVLPWKERDHALFIGYAPVQAPRFAVSVIIEHGGSGAHTAAPIARDILLECQKKGIS
jgi:penicillin-binding protein 2